MTDADERILDLALEEAVGGRIPPDLSALILRSAADRRTSPAAPLPDPHAPRPGLRLRTKLAVAASLLLCCGVLWLVIRSEDAAARAARHARRLGSDGAALTPDLRKALPGVEDRPAAGDERTWMRVLLEAAQRGEGKTPAAADLDVLAVPALRGARDLAEFDVLFRILEERASNALVLKLLEDSSPLVREEAACILGQRGANEALPGLLRRLQDKDAEVRDAAAWALGALEAREAVPHLALLLEDADVFVRKSAAWSLGRLRSEEAVPLLLVRLGDDGFGLREPGRPMSRRDPSPPSVRDTAAAALTRIGTVDALLEVVRRLAAPDAIDVDAFFPALEAAGAKEGSRNLLARLHAANDPSGRLRAAVVRVLGNLAAREAIPDLEPLLGDANENVREAAAGALEKLGRRPR